MSEYIHLIGAEQVEHAARIIDTAADTMNRAAASIDSALENHRRYLEEWIGRFENALEQPTHPTHPQTDDPEPCDDCGVDTIDIRECFMVDDKIWPKGATFLCLDCLEKRIGRTLTSNDFIACPLNEQDYEFQSPKLMLRIFGRQS
jgi:hypothetical protein